MVGLDGKSSTLEAVMNLKAKYSGFQSRKYKNGSREESKNDVRRVRNNLGGPNF